MPTDSVEPPSTQGEPSDSEDDEETLVVKLGDFGTIFKLKDGDPSTFGGTRAFWSPVEWQSTLIEEIYTYMP